MNPAPRTRPVPNTQAWLVITLTTVLWLALGAACWAIGWHNAAWLLFIGPAIAAVLGLLAILTAVFIAGDQIHHIRDTHRMDDIDRSTDQQQAALDARLARRQQYQGTSRTHCLDCEDPIPEPRRALIAGCSRCASCQDHAERRAGRLGLS